MKLTANQLYFISQAVTNVQIKGQDAVFVAEVITKVQKELEKQAKAEGLEMPNANPNPNAVPPAQGPGAGMVPPPSAAVANKKETA